MSRTGRVERQTSESKVLVEVDLDGTGRHDISTGVGFYDHMLTAFARHALVDLTVQTDGDVHIDAHHTVEDTAIALGQALRQALGDKKGVRRFGDATVPLDEALVQAVVDVSGRPYCVHTGEPEGQQYVQLGGSGVSYLGSLTQHVFESIAFHAHLALHVRVLAGREPHHIVETQFKAFARAFRSAVQPVEIAAALQRECDNNAQILSRQRRLVPNDFHVELAQTDLERLAPYDSAMAAELEKQVTEHAQQNGYSFPGPVSIDFEASEDLTTGRFRVRSRALAKVSSNRVAHRRPRPRLDQRHARRRPEDEPLGGRRRHRGHHRQHRAQGQGGLRGCLS